MRTIIAAVVLATAIAYAGQDPQQPMAATQPKELRALSCMMGTWDADLKMYEPGSMQATPLKGTVVTAATLNGMWIEARHEAVMGEMPMKALEMTCYDAAKKQYRTYWFDSTGPGGLEFLGTLKGQTLVLLSKPEEIPGMPGKSTFRSTTSMKGAGKLLFRLEINSGKGWSKMIEGTMTRK